MHPATSLGMMNATKRTLLSDDTLRADVVHALRCTTRPLPRLEPWMGESTPASRQAAQFPSLGETAMMAADYLPADNEELEALVRSARYRGRIRRAAARDGRPDLERRIADHKHALRNLGRACFYLLKDEVSECRCSLHEVG